MIIFVVIYHPVYRYKQIVGKMGVAKFAYVVKKGMFNFWGCLGSSVTETIPKNEIHNATREMAAEFIRDN